MASTNKDDIGVRSFPVSNWELGIITSQPPTEIPDNAVVDLLNLEWDEAGNLSTRCGLTELMADTFTDRITSAHHFSNDEGDQGILFTTGAKLYRVDTDGDNLTEITSALTLPDDTFWDWATFGGVAIGCNKATSGDNPIKVVTGGTASALGGSPPKARYIEVWDNRVWLVSATEPNQVWGSGVGNEEDWDISPETPTAATAVAIDIDPDDGDIITGLFATRGALYIFKRKRIFKIVQVTPTEDNPQGYKVEIHAQSIGCVSPYSIRPALDDVLYFSEQGIASLSLSETTEGFRTALYSRNVAELSRMPKTTEEIPSLLLEDAAQYWISIPASMSTRQINETYVMDYLRIDQKIVRWTRFDGLAAFTAATSFLGPNGKVYVVGAQNSEGEYQLFTYQPNKAGGPFTDNGEPYTKSMTTKAYDISLPLQRKWWKRWGFKFEALTNSAQASVQYFYDGNILKGGDQSFTLNASTEGAFWDQALWDDSTWDSAVRETVNVTRRFLSNSSGQKSRTVSFVVSNGQNNEALKILEFTLWFSLLSERRSSDI